MRYEIITTICISVLAIITILSIIAIFIYDKNKGKQTLSTSNDITDWLFSNFQHTVFTTFYKNPKGESLCGINIEEYYRYCKIVHESPSLENLVALRIEAAGISFILLLLALLMSYNITFTAVCLLIAAGIIYLLWIMPFSQIKNKAEERLFHIQDDLPRFLSLLEKAMDLPIDQAMIVTATKFQSPLSEDIIDSINKVSLGANGWTETLVDLAKVYKIEDFSDLILEIVNSYEQGVNVRELVNRKAKEVEETRLYAVEAHDSKIKTLIFLPIIALKVLPLMVMICLPMLSNFV
jgi:Flp pilus assembly protein TadB